MLSCKNLCGFIGILFLCFGVVSTALSQESNAIKSYHQNKAVTSPKCNEFTFDATGSYDPDNETLSYFWDFGDGKTSSEPISTHAYNQPGDYNVTLTISDNSGMECSTAITTQRVRVNIPPHAIFSSDSDVCVNQLVTLDASNSYNEGSRRLNYLWDFGDGSKISGKEQVSKSYTEGGNYKVTLTVDDGSNTMCGIAKTDKVIHVNAPPKAKAQQNNILQCVSSDSDLVVAFNAAPSSDPNGDPLNYYWDFGDGNRQEGIQVTHHYNEIKNYDVKLVVKDNTNYGCSTDIDFITVRLNKAPQANAGNDVLSCTGEEVVFDGTDSYAYKKGTLAAQWNFGDGQNADGLKVTHRYLKPGKYQATLTVENKLNSSCPASRDTKSVVINTTPSVTLSVPESSCLGNKVNFDASAATDIDGDSLEYFWTFGDGTVLKGGPKVSHQFTQGGNYRVSVVVDDKMQTPCSTATAYANIRINTPPVADIGPNTACCVDALSNFDASNSSDPDGDRLTYSWDFGDGAKSNGAVAQHIYEKSGTYTVNLTVDDNTGTACSTSKASYVTQVNTSPVPVMTIR